MHAQHDSLDLTTFHYAAIFLICSVLGLAGETVVSFVLDGRWESRAGFVIGPLSPIYGLGAVVITAVVNPLRSRPVACQFIAAGLVGGAVEYLAGWLLEARYGIVAWSYIDQPLNFHGHTSIIMIAVWGVIGVVWSAAILPRVFALVERVPARLRRPITAVALAFIFVDSALTIACLDSWFWRMSGHAPTGPVQQFCAQFFGNEFMSKRFETMGMWTELAKR